MILQYIMLQKALQNIKVFEFMDMEHKDYYIVYINI